MKKLLLAIPLAAALMTSCNSDKTTTTPVAPYDATGNWLFTITNIDSLSGAKSFTAPSTIPAVMTNKGTGDFKIDYPVDGVITNVATGNTVSGKMHFALGSTADGKLGWADCYGAFNASQNTYHGQCYPEGYTTEQRKQLDASGNKVMLDMKRQ